MTNEKTFIQKNTSSEILWDLTEEKNDAMKEAFERAQKEKEAKESKKHKAK